MNWQIVHEAMCRLARDKASYDAEEATWLVEVDRFRVWEEMGLGSFVEYCERVLGYTPRTSMERLRVAKALKNLPHLRTALGDGALAWSAIRELSRIVTPETEIAWIDAVEELAVHEVETMVAGREKGDHPNDPVKPSARPRTLTLVVSADTYAALREARNQIELEVGHSVDDDELLRTIAERACQPVAEADQDGTGPARRHQVLITVCASCARGFRQGAGMNVEIDRAAIDTALCDAQVIDATHVGDPERAGCDSPPKTWRAVWRRDHGQCVVPGCRAAKYLDVHHIVTRADGGSHDAWNLCVLCSIHHRQLHAGKLTIIGRAPDTIEFRAADGARYGTLPECSPT